MLVSPWATDVKVPSPDGVLFAELFGGEISMGGPTVGNLEISNGIFVESCNPSMVWSSDSTQLAIPQWTNDRKQQILIIDVQRRLISCSTDVYRVLELHSFDGQIVRGVDSPYHLPVVIEVDVSNMRRVGQEQ